MINLNNVVFKMIWKYLDTHEQFCAIHWISSYWYLYFRKETPIHFKRIRNIIYFLLQKTWLFVRAIRLSLNSWATVPHSDRWHQPAASSLIHVQPCLWRRAVSKHCPLSTSNSCKLEKNVSAVKREQCLSSSPNIKCFYSDFNTHGHISWRFRILWISFSQFSSCDGHCV